MPSFHDTTTSAAPPEEVWKLLYDPSRFPDWWAGIGTVDVTGRRRVHDVPGRLSRLPDGPAARHPTRRAARHASHAWSPTCASNGGSSQHGEGTLITVDVEIPEAEAHRLESQREIISTSMQQLAQLAAET